MKVSELIPIIVLSVLSMGCCKVMFGASAVQMCDCLSTGLAEVRQRMRSGPCVTPQAPSTPQSVRPIGHALYVSGLHCFEKFEYLTALNQFADAIAAGDMDGNETAACHFYRGAIFTILEQKGKAIVEFQKCKSICPDYSPSREIFRPDVISLYEACPKN